MKVAAALTLLACFGAAAAQPFLPGTCPKLRLFRRYLSSLASGADSLDGCCAKPAWNAAQRSHCVPPAILAALTCKLRQRDRSFLVSASFQTSFAGTGFAPLGNLRTTDQDGPYSLEYVPVQVAEVRGE
jgi:hypothetical protein